MVRRIFTIPSRAEHTFKERLGCGWNFHSAQLHMDGPGAASFLRRHRKPGGGGVLFQGCQGQRTWRRVLYRRLCKASELLICRIKEAFVRYHVPPGPPWYIAYLVDLNLMSQADMWSLARSRQHSRKMLWNPQRPGKRVERGWGMPEHELFWAERGSGGLNSGIKIRKRSCHRHWWEDFWFPNCHMFSHKHSWSQGWIC